MLGLALSLVAPLVALLAPAPARGQQMTSTPSRPWLDPALLAAAKAEGSLIVYSSTNEQEGLPLFKLFTDATGIKVEYVRASDAVLMSRMAIEYRRSEVLRRRAKSGHQQDAVANVGGVRSARGQ